MIFINSSQFAKLHNVNPRTLHYYDDIGLFSPKQKGENGYRYYDSSQGLTFEYIRMLKELHMSIEEIKHYLSNPNPDDFKKIADRKSAEITAQIQKLKQTQHLLDKRRRQIAICEHAFDETIHIVTRKQERLLITSSTFENDDLSSLLIHIKQLWGIEQYRVGIGSYISVDRLLQKQFDEYDGLFSYALPGASSNELYLRPKAEYLCTYFKGTWDSLPDKYRQIIAYAEEHRLKLTGYAYEWGMNEFAIKDERDYITQILIQIDRKP